MALYKGTLSPLVGCGFQVSIQFGFNEMSKRFFSRFKENPTDILPLHLVACSGFVAGLGSGLLAVLHFQFRLPFNMQGSESKYRRLRQPKSTMALLRLPRRLHKNMA